MKLLDKKITSKINDMITDIVDTCSRILSTEAKVDETQSYDSKDSAKNRLKLVLMHDRSQLSPGQMEQMRDELVEVISRYVEIDREALDLCLESETNTIALVANIPLMRGVTMASCAAPVEGAQEDVAAQEDVVAETESQEEKPAGEEQATVHE